MKKITIIMMIMISVCISTADDVTTSAQVSNSLPVASSAELNGGADIVLTANSTRSVVGTVTITDTNGCADIQNVTATLFRTNITGGSGAADNDRNHYSVICTSNSDCSGGSDTTETFTCTFNVHHFADATDIGSLYDTTDWTFNATPADATSEGTSDSANQEIQTLTSVAVATTSISFGTLAVGADTGASNTNTTLYNTGNEPLDFSLRAYGSIDPDGYCMTCTTGNIDVGYLEYASSNFVYGSGTDMQQVDNELDVDLDRGSTGDETPVGYIYYGLGFPASGISGTCSGTIVLTAESDPTTD